MIPTEQNSAPGIAPGIDLLSILSLLGGQKSSQQNQLLTHFGFQSKPRRVTDFGGGTVNPLTGRSESRGLDQFFSANPHHRQGESFAEGRKAQIAGNQAFRQNQALQRKIDQKNLLDQLQ